MYFLGSGLIFVILLPLYYAYCTNCGYGYCLESGSNNTCVVCACPSNFSGSCCEVQPAGGCAVGYYGENCSQVDCSAQRGTSFYFQNHQTTPIDSSIQPTAHIPCGTGTLWCLTATNNTDWLSGRGNPGNGASYDLLTNCPNPCIKDINNEYWEPTDYNYTRFYFRPYCGSASSCGVYVFQSWVLSNGTSIPPATNSSGLYQTSDVGFRPVLTERGPTGKLSVPIPIGQPTSYDYIIATGVSCSGCPFNTSGCELVNWAPPTPSCNLVCLNGGMCVEDTNGTSYCQCLDIWTGSNCSNYCPTANPVTQQTTTANPVAQQIAASLNQSNFNQAYLPYILANMTLEEKMNASWQVNDLYTWAAYEDTELDLNLMNITGLMLGLSVICLFEMAYLAIRLFHVICMNEEAVHTLMDRHSVEQAKKNCFNVPTVCPEDHPLGC
uniref:EGF-like domain-containing protein n=1 Tax=Acrobeloides nanus TaxID=290746 RepID=A0A914CDF0_9BILA